MDRETWLEHALVNRVQSLLLLAVMAGFLMLIGWLLWGPGGVLWPAIAVAAALAVSPAMTPALVMRLYRAVRLAPDQAPALGAALAELARRAGLDHVPDLYYVPSRMVNAFAVGSRARSAIAVTDGLLRTLSLRETVGVLAHEVSHVRSNDLQVMGLADLFSRMTGVLSLLGQVLVLVNLPLMLMGEVVISWPAVLLLVLAPNVSALVQLGLSRVREHDADLNAVALTGDPRGLASALAKIERLQGGLLERVLLPGRRVPEPSVLRTHPPTHERLRRLRELEISGEPLVADASPPLGPGARRHRPVRRGPRWHVSGLWH